MKALLFASPTSVNPICSIEFDDDYWMNSEEMDWVATCFGANYIEYI